MRTFDLPLPIFDLPARPAGRLAGRVAPPRSAGGFTMIELLLSIFIFAIGLTAIASIFPVGGYLQRESYDEITTLQVKHNAEAVLLTRGVDAAIVSADNTIDTSGTVQALPAAAMARLALADRSYPTASSDPVGQRDYYWIPLVQDVEPAAGRHEWRVFAFICPRRRGAEYANAAITANPTDPDSVPKVVAIGCNTSGNTVTASHGGNIQGGDQFLLNTGQIAQASTVNGNTIEINGQVTGNPDRLWYGRPHAAGARGPTQRIIAVGTEAVK
jgi:prepilin-type N-terminal cleavage/methylation domain-containing protein